MILELALGLALIQNPQVELVTPSHVTINYNNYSYYDAIAVPQGPMLQSSINLGVAIPNNLGHNNLTITKTNNSISVLSDSELNPNVGDSINISMSTEVRGLFIVQSQHNVIFLSYFDSQPNLYPPLVGFDVDNNGWYDWTSFTGESIREFAVPWVSNPRIRSYVNYTDSNFYSRVSELNILYIENAKPIEKFPTNQPEFIGWFRDNATSVNFLGLVPGQIRVHISTNMLQIPQQLYQDPNNLIYVPADVVYNGNGPILFSVPTQLLRDLPTMYLQAFVYANGTFQAGNVIKVNA